MDSRVTFQPEGKTIAVPRGTSVLDAARRARIAIKTRCGGKAGCLMCKVRVLSEDGIAPAREQELRKLGSDIDRGIRLSCQARVVGHAVVEVPEDPLRSAVRRLLEQQDEDDALW